MPPLSNAEDILSLYLERGGLSYGEDVNQVEHAVQCAVLAQAEGCTPSLIIAALLHDVGHLFEAEADVVRSDHRHEVAGAAALAGLFGPDVCAPIALHVAAKRWLCLRSPGYLDALSAASKRSLELQGGPFDEAQASAFERQPAWREAVQLRRFDDAGKCDDASARSFADFAELIRSVAT